MLGKAWKEARKDQRRNGESDTRRGAYVQETRERREEGPTVLNAVDVE